MLKAIGKTIDTLPLASLFSQEEKYADTVQIEVDRFYGTHDLAGFSFLLRGVTPSGGETECMLTKTVREETLLLSWTVSEDFTSEPGELQLDLAACHYAEGDDPSEDEPDVVLRYQMPPVRVRPLPDAMHTLDTQSYTVFLLQVRAAAEEGIAEMTALTDEFADKIDAYDAHFQSLDNSVTSLGTRVTSLEAAQSGTESDVRSLQSSVTANTNAIQSLSTTVSGHTTSIQSLDTTVSGHTSSIQSLQTQVNAIPPIVILTQAEYDALASKDAGTLYIVT